jgi:NAD(P)H-quinone oxidoreductase subunit K
MVIGSGMKAGALQGKGREGSGAGIGMSPGERLMNPAINTGITKDLSENVILTTVDDLYNWTRLSSLFPLLYGTACCFIEFAALLGSRFDFDRFGLAPRASPRQADLIIVAGTVTMKMAPALVRLYEQMPKPAYVIAMGACTITGGMFSADSPTALRGVDKVIPVDVYIPGCPPRPEAIFDAIIKLRKKIANESMQERSQFESTHRFYTRSHSMKTVDPILTGTYLASGTREAPPKELMAAMGMPVALDEVKADAKEGAMAKPSKGIADGLDKENKA